MAARDGGGVSLGLLDARSADRRPRLFEFVGINRIIRELRLHPVQHPFRKT